MRKKSWGENKRSIFDKAIEKIRFLEISKHIKGPTVLDLGCGYNASLLRSVEDKIKLGVGVDISVDENLKSGKIKLVPSRVDRKINLEPDLFDTIVSLAVIEHVDDPVVMLKEAFRHLKGGGTFLLTTPSSHNQPILNLLAKIGVVSKHEIEDHKRYYDKTTLLKTFIDAGFKKNKIRIKYFELGLNIFVKAIK